MDPGTWDDLLNACAEGNLRAVKRLVGQHVLAAHHTDALWMACENGHRDVVCWLLGRFGLTADDSDRALPEACLSDGAVARRQVRRVGAGSRLWSDVPARAARNGLITSCADGNIPVAAWLTDQFGLAAADARNYHNCALRLACINGHLAVAT
jgi:hypothetical protein